MKVLIDWVDHRTGARKLVHEALFENVPGGARWRYVWGSTLTFGLFIQFVTGIFLWMSYSPSAQTAWESVYYIQHQMTGGWLLRGIHHYTAQVMTVLLVLHLMQVVIDGAYKAPREVNYWFGVLLLGLVLALSLTGYLLPWDQKGYWATKVATNIAAIVPVVGPSLQKLIIGGTEYGHHTLTRFFALHAGILPGAVIALLIGHIYLFRRHGLTAKEPKKKPDSPFWPDQVLRDAVACLTVLATVLFFVVRHRLFGEGELGAELGAPADPSEAYSAARPDWYFLFLFQFLKYFPGKSEIIGAIIIPGVLFTILLLLPFFGRLKRGHQFNLAFLWVMLGGAGVLTYLALAQDRGDSHYVASVKAANQEAARVKVLAGSPAGIPQGGAVNLLREDPLTQGPKLFAKHCASCHRYDGHDGMERIPKDPQSAPDLKGFATREWIAATLDPQKIASSNFFGGTKFSNGKMVRYVQRTFRNLTPELEDQRKAAVAALSAEAQLTSQITVDASSADLIKRGRELMVGDLACTDCHAFGKPDEEATAPLLTGYGSRTWLIGMIGNPAHQDYYGTRNDRMPAYEKDQILDAKSIALIADWLRGDWYVPPAEIQPKKPIPQLPASTVTNR